MLQEPTELDQVLDHLLQRGQPGDAEGEVVGEIIMETGKSFNHSPLNDSF